MRGSCGNQVLARPTTAPTDLKSAAVERRLKQARRSRCSVWDRLPCARSKVYERTRFARDRDTRGCRGRGCWRQEYLARSIVFQDLGIDVTYSSCSYGQPGLCGSLACARRRDDRSRDQSSRASWRRLSSPEPTHGRRPPGLALRTALEYPEDRGEAFSTLSQFCPGRVIQG